MDPCCICLEHLNNESSIFYPTCCIAGVMHIECGKKYIMHQRIEHGNDFVFTCPGCRESYEADAISQLSPSIETFKCSGSFWPLQEDIRYEVVVLEETNELLTTHYPVWNLYENSLQDTFQNLNVMMHNTNERIRSELNSNTDTDMRSIRIQRRRMLRISDKIQEIMNIIAETRTIMDEDD